MGGASEEDNCFPSTEAVLMPSPNGHVMPELKSGMRKELDEEPIQSDVADAKATLADPLTNLSDVETGTPVTVLSVPDETFLGSPVFSDLNGEGTAEFQGEGAEQIEQNTVRSVEEDILELKTAKASLQATCEELQLKLKLQEQKLAEALEGVQSQVDRAMQDAMLACHKHVEAILEMKLQKESGISDGLFWQPMGPGVSLPQNAVPARGGFYIGRARHQAHIIPGRVDPGAGTCYITFGGREHLYREFEILVNRGGLVNLAWRPGMNGSVPPSAVVGGRQANYPAPLYVGRMRGSGRPGKLAAYGNNCLFVGDGNGREIEADQYEVLTVVTQGGTQAVVL